MKNRRHGPHHGSTKPVGVVIIIILIIIIMTGEVIIITIIIMAWVVIIMMMLMTVMASETEFWQFWQRLSWLTRGKLADEQTRTWN